MVSAGFSAGFTPAAALDAVYGPGSAKRVREARILVVGAGGVGCELIKNLACTGFGSITVIDLDTIDVSNLNRQFLFRKHHVGQSKAVEAAASIARMVPGTSIEGLVGNVKESRFGVPFFKSFNLVCNALDNLEARRHVNRMCLAAEVPLVESGSTGYIGQAAVIGQGVECYDCTQKPQPKSYAVCTIRSTPDKPVHCVVWAKFLYELIFGPDDDGNVLKDLDGGVRIEANGTAEPDSHAGEANGANGANCADDDSNADVIELENEAENGDVNHKPQEQPVSKPNAKRVRYVDGEDAETFAKRVCERVFVEDIRIQRAMKDLWKDRDPPLVYDVDAVADKSSEDVEKVNLLDQTAWTPEKSAAVFKATLKRIVEKRNAEIGSLTFDKDDGDALLFVAAASNLRSHAYGVPLQSPFSVKGIAGNIIHAIATTNAIVGGLIVLEALKLTANEGDLRDCLTIFVSKAPIGERVKKILYPEPLRKKNEKCFVCSKGQLQLIIDVEKMTLQTLVSAVLQKKMSVMQPTVNVTTGEFHNTLYECGSGLEEDEVEEYNSNLGKTLHELRVADGSQLVVEDFSQNLTCTVHVSHEKGLLEDKPESEQFTLEGKVIEAKAGENGVTGAESDNSAEDVDDECLEVPVQQKPAKSVAKPTANVKEGVAVMEADVSEEGGKKRGLEDVANGSTEGEREAKRARSESGDAVGTTKS